MELNTPAEAMHLADSAVQMADLAQSDVPVADRVAMLIQLTRAAAQSGAAAHAAYRAPISWTRQRP